MSIRAWSDDLISGFPKIDAQHKKLFQTISDFSDKHYNSASSHDAIEFLNELEIYCRNHFNYEESLMMEHSFPLTDYHINLHKDLKRLISKMRNHAEQLNLTDPHKSIIKVCADWLHNHIAWEDLTFISFYRNREYSLGDHFVGRKCELLTIDNKLLGTGDIQSIQKSEVVVANTSNTAIPLKMNEMVKVKSVSETQENQTFLARVFFSIPEIVKLFNATIIQTVNKRQHFRVSAKLAAKLLAHEKVFPVVILDISAGGLMVESLQELQIGDVVTVNFIAQETKFKEPCEIVRVIPGSGSTNTYGVKFLSLSHSLSDKINSYVFTKQASVRRMYRKSE